MHVSENECKPMNFFYFLKLQNFTQTKINLYTYKNVQILLQFKNSDCQQTRYIYSSYCNKHDTEIFHTIFSCPEYTTIVSILPGSGAIPSGTGDHGQPVQNRQIKSLQFSEPSKGMCLCYHCTHQCQ